MSTLKRNKDALSEKNQGMGLRRHCFSQGTLGMVFEFSIPCRNTAEPRSHEVLGTA